MREKIVFIIPGFKHKPTNKGYKQIARMLKKEGYVSIPITIPWRKTTISQNTQHFLKKYQKKVSKIQSTQKNIYFLGFSYGAMIALLAATKISVKGLILCSLSPFFKEDLPKQLPKKITSLQKKRYESFSQLKYRQLSKKVKAKKVMMLYGSKESKTLIRRVTKAYKEIPSSRKYLLPVKKTDHNIADVKYLQAIRAATSFL